MSATTADPAEAPATEDAPRDGTDGDPEAPESEGEAAADLRRIQRHDTGGLAIATPAALLAAGLGIVFSRPALVLVSAVAVGLLAFRQSTTEPTPSLAVSRSISPADPDPGDVVDVRTTVRNVGDGTLPDCRLVDLVPDELCVVEGSPRVATTLRAGEEQTIAYSIRARRGSHEFGGVHAVVADLAHTVETEYEVRAPDVVECRPEPAPLPATVLRSLTTPYAGRQPTDQAGEGIEFHATREYRPGDSLRRIDWNRFASTGELATLQFRTERAAAVVLLADVRPESYVRADPDDDHAADRAVEVVGRLFVSLLEEDHRAGIATLGPDFYLDPGAGSDHRVRGLTALGSEPALSPIETDERMPLRLRLRSFRRQFPDDAQVILCSPLADDTPVMAARVIESYGYQVTVVSPDPTDESTPGAIVARLERRGRIRRLQRLGVPVVDWSADDSLDVAVARVAARWSG